MNQSVETVDVDSARLWTARTGVGTPMIWLHGGPGLWDMLGPLAEMTDDLATTYRFDQRACGRSTGDGPHTLARNIADIEALRIHWDLDRFIVAGHSWGATLALHYALTHPARVAGVIYLSGTGIDPSWKDDHKAERTRRLGADGAARFKLLDETWQKTCIAQDEHAFCRLSWSTDFADTERGYALAGKMLRDDVRVNSTVNRDVWADAEAVTYTAEMRDRVRHLTAPFIALHGRADPRSARGAQSLAALVPNGRFIALDNTGHVPWLENPDALRRALRDFVQQDAMR